MRLSGLLFALCFSLACAPLAAGVAEPEWTALGWNGRGCDGDVASVIELDDGSLLLGGTFSACGEVSATALVLYDPATNVLQALPAAAGFRGPVRQLLKLGDDLYVGGDRMMIPGASGEWAFARLDLGTGQWSVPAGSPGGPGDMFSAMVSIDGEIYLALQSGSPNLSRYDPVNAIWTELVTFQNPVRSLSADGGDLIAGGFFTQIEGVSALNIARFDPQSGTWSPLSAGLSGFIQAIAVDADAIYAAGQFTFAGGLPTDRVARFDRVSESWTPVGTGTVSTEYVSALAIVGNDLYAGGLFSAIDGVVAANVARFDALANQWQPLGDGVAGEYAPGVSRLHPLAGELYLSGGFQYAGGELQNRFARYQPATGNWLRVGEGSTTAANGLIYETISTGDSVVLIGSFTQIGGVSAREIAVMDCQTMEMGLLGGINDHQISGDIYTTIHHQGAIYIGGNFTGVGGISAPFLARYQLASGQWESLGDGLDGATRALLADGDDLYVAGDFFNAGGLSARGIAKLDLQSGQWSALGSGAQNGTNGFVAALAKVDDDIFVGGWFQEAGGLAAANIARFDLASGSWSVPTGGVDDMISDMKLVQGGLYISGGFFTANGTPARGLARLDLASGQWSAPGGGAQTGPMWVDSFLLRNGRLLVAGIFRSMAGIPMNSIGSLDPGSQQWSALGEGVDYAYPDFVPADVTGTAVCGDRIVVGGGFQLAGGQTSTNLALLRLPGPLFVDDFE